MLFRSDLIPIRHVAEMLSLYARIIDLRYPNRYRFRIDVDQTIEEVRVLKFIFQPLLENAFVHGVSKTGGSVSARFQRDPRGVLFSVEDDGRGIRPERLREIKSALRSDGTNVEENFALVNVDRQIRLYYRIETGIEIVSRWGEGTRVTVVLPERGENDDV